MIMVPNLGFVKRHAGSANNNSSIVTGHYKSSYKNMYCQNLFEYMKSL